MESAYNLHTEHEDSLTDSFARTKTTVFLECGTIYGLLVIRRMRQHKHNIQELTKSKIWQQTGGLF